MRFFGAIAVAILAAALLPSCTCGMPEGDYWGHVKEDVDATHLHFCNSGEPQWLDPALTTSTTGIKLVYAMWDGLTKHDLNGLPEPSVADRWDISPDQRTFTFHLRDDARWSHGRPLTAHDFRYHIIRILHPLTASNNTDPHWKLKNGKLFTENKLRTLMTDVGPFKKGDIVKVIEPAGSATEPAAELTYSNERRAKVDLELRDFPGFWDWCTGDCKPFKQPYYTLSSGSLVTIIDVENDAEGNEWAYIHNTSGEGIYGWVPTSNLEVYDQSHADFQYKVRKVPRTQVPGLDVPMEEIAAAAEEPQPEGMVKASDVMMLPEAVGVRVIDDHTLVLETANPIPYMIDQSVQRAYRASPIESVSRRPLTWSKPANGILVTSGAFHMTEWAVRDYVRMKKSPTYWNRDNVKLETITAYSMDDQAASANYYFQGSCDAIYSSVLASYLPLLNGSKRDGRAYKDYTAAPYLGVYIYLINTEKFKNKHFRRALTMGIHREPIPRILNGGQIPTVQAMPGKPISQLSDEELETCGVTRDQKGVASVMITGELCYVPPPGLDYDIEAAKKELALAKEQMGSEFKKSFSLKFNSGVEGHKLIAEYIQNEWKKNLGLDVVLEVQEWKTFLSDTNNGEYDVARMGWILNFPDVEAELMPQFRCGAPDNRTKYCSEEFDSWLDKAEKTFDRKKRVELVKNAEAVLLQDAPIIPLYVYTQQHLQKPYVRDLSINPGGQLPFEKVWIDPDWKSRETTQTKAN